MSIILVSIFATIVLFIIYILSSREERDIQDRFAAHGKIEGYYSGGPDRRRAERFNAELDVKYNLLKAQPSRLQTNSKNISESGIAVLVYEILPKDSLVDMDIVLPGRDDAIKTKGRIAWCEDRNGLERFDKEGKRTFMAGIEFVDTEKKQRDRLLSYINNNLAVVR